MRFRPVFFKDKLKIINDEATLGIITLWSEKDFIIRRLKKAGVDLNHDTSETAVIGNLYGGGFKYLLRNLLFNPHIDTLLVLGNDRSGSFRYLLNFFSRGTEPAESNVTYKSASGQDAKTVRIIGTDYIMDSLVSLDMFTRIPKIVRIEGIEKPGSEASGEAAEFLKNYKSARQIGERVYADIPEVVLETCPSNPRAHTIVEETPSDAWRYLVHRVFRFGNRVSVRKGERIELQNVKVVIENPRFEDESVIRDCGFDPDSFLRYQEEILSAECSDDKPYTYGHRIRAYFGTDCLERVADNLIDGPDDRNCYISTWDNTTDIDGEHRPCLASLFFRKTGNELHLTSTFRTHNTSDAWLENVYGLMAIQDYICRKIGAETGSITIISHSISLDPRYLEKVKPIYDKAARISVIRHDPNGYFLITTHDKDIVVKHCHNSDHISEYRSDRPLKIQQMMYRDCVISDIGHAIYIGRQLERAYQCIRENIPYIQDN
ncbi:hypothetical protein QUF80_06855 [Desulfococcaceae bacterium HSG8]|nr:hypothetical protein [Desulfococcaceae bacterium HSG8]